MYPEITDEMRYLFEQCRNWVARTFLRCHRP